MDLDNDIAEPGLRCQLFAHWPCDDKDRDLPPDCRSNSCATASSNSPVTERLPHESARPCLLRSRGHEDDAVARDHDSWNADIRLSQIGLAVGSTRVRSRQINYPSYGRRRGFRIGLAGLYIGMGPPLPTALHLAATAWWSHRHCWRMRLPVGLGSNSTRPRGRGGALAVRGRWMVQLSSRLPHERPDFENGTVE
jgi:hypothetical protein